MFILSEVLALAIESDIKSAVNFLKIKTALLGVNFISFSWIELAPGYVPHGSRRLHMNLL